MSQSVCLSYSIQNTVKKEITGGVCIVRNKLKYMFLVPVCSFFWLGQWSNSLNCSCSHEYGNLWFILKTPLHFHEGNCHQWNKMNWFTRTLNLNYIPDNKVFFHCQIVVRVFVVYESNCIGLKYIKYEWNLEHVMEYIYFIYR